MEIGTIYKGKERRYTIRRVNINRREMIRFEPNKEDRRSSKDRRVALNTWKYSS